MSCIARGQADSNQKSGHLSEGCTRWSNREQPFCSGTASHSKYFCRCKQDFARHMQLQADAGLLLLPLPTGMKSSRIVCPPPLSPTPKLGSIGIYPALHRLAHGTLAQPHVDPAQRIERSHVSRRTGPPPPMRPCARGFSPSTKATAMTIHVTSAALLIAPGRQAAVHEHQLLMAS